MYIKMLFLLLSVIFLPNAHSAVSEKSNFKPNSTNEIKNKKADLLKMVMDNHVKASYALILDEETQEPTCFVDLAGKQDVTPDFMQALDANMKSNIQLNADIPQCDSNQEMELAFTKNNFLLEGTQVALAGTAVSLGMPYISTFIGGCGVGMLFANENQSYPELLKEGSIPIIAGSIGVGTFLGVFSSSIFATISSGVGIGAAYGVVATAGYALCGQSRLYLFEKTSNLLFKGRNQDFIQKSSTLSDRDKEELIQKEVENIKEAQAIKAAAQAIVEELIQKEVEDIEAEEFETEEELTN